MNAVNPFKPITIYEGIVTNNHEAQQEYQQIIKELRQMDILVSEDEEVELEYSHTPPMETDYFASQTEEGWEAKMDYWGPFCEKYLKPLVTDVTEKEDCGELALDDVWTQITSGFMQHHPHDHGDVGYSFVWYIDVDPSVHQGTLYYDPNNSKDNQYQTEVQVGKVCIWPSWLLHYQPPSNSDIKRYIISGNLAGSTERLH